MLNNLALKLKEDVKPLNLADLTDEGLVNEFVCGSSEAFNHIVKRYDKKIYSLALKITKNHHDAENISQEVFLTLLNKIDTFQGKASFSTWLYRVSANASFAYLRKNKDKKNWLPLREEEVMLDRDTPEDLVSIRETWQKMECVLARMNKRQKDVLLLVNRENMTAKETSQILGLSVKCIKTRLHRARYLLSGALVDNGNEINHRFKP